MATPRITLRLPVPPVAPSNASADLKAYAAEIAKYLAALQRELDSYTNRVDQLIKAAELLP